VRENFLAVSKECRQAQNNGCSVFTSPRITVTFAATVLTGLGALYEAVERRLRLGSRLEKF
jgi:hypothetical protein